MARDFLPDHFYEDEALAGGALRVAGVDEVGRGPLAGPVFAAAVVLRRGHVPEGLADSKVLTAARRAELAALIHAHAEVSIAEASVEEIDELNILRASHLAMVRALAGLAAMPDHALIDGHMIPRNMPCGSRAIIQGDALCLSIAAASIVAKVARDQRMVDLAQQCPGYGWDRNVGYPTPEHRTALLNLGATAHHRRSFAPVHNILYQVKILNP